MKQQQTAVSEADILNEVIGPDVRQLNAEAAKSILELAFSKTATRRIRTLLRGNNRGALSAEERIELEKYLRVGQLVDLLQARARATLAARKAA